MVNSSTIVLPAWQRLLEELHKPNCIMHCDVTICWNSTYDMLNFALEYHKAIDSLTVNRQNELRAYELNEREWSIARQLLDILEVCGQPSIINGFVIINYSGFERHNFVLLTFHTKSCYHYTCHGLHQ